MSTRCAICSDPAKLDLVTAALLTGERPSDILKRYPGIASSSSLYRHARSHRPKSSLAPSWIDGDTTTGEVLSDLSGLRRNLLQQYRDQLSRGDSSASTRSAHEAHAVSATLLRAGVADDEVTDRLAQLDRIMHAIRKAALRRPAWASDFAEDCRLAKDFELADEFENFALIAEQHLNRTTRS